MHAQTQSVYSAPPEALGAAVSAPSHNIAYRPDVDGLRAIAVLAVLAFHAFPQVLTGGFAGVDIFFVISGYLISAIILSDLSAERFSFLGFYRRRVLRIFPALAIVLAFSLVFGWWALVPADYRQLGAQVAAGAGFVSNLQLWSESGYFDTAAEFKPLLHLWSLGVEEQYYLVWPLLLIILQRHGAALGRKIMLLAAASFAISLFLLRREPTAAFYWPIGRFWELMVGSFLAYQQLRTAPLPARLENNRTVSNVFAAAGLICFAAAFVLLDQHRDFPGFWALLPCLGCGLLLQAGPRAWLNQQLLGNRVLVFVGLISYPLYLWHWPLLTYARIMFGELTVLTRLAILGLSGLLAWATYAFIEQKVRRRPARGSRRVVVSACILSVLLLGIVGLLGATNTLPARSASVPRLAAISEAFSDRAYRGDRTIPGDAQRSVLFFGDSHMQQYLPRIETLMREHRAPVRTVIMWTGAGCAPLPGVDRTGHHCEEFVQKGFRIAGGPQVDTVVIAASWVGMTERKDYYAPGGPKPLRVDLRSPESSWILDGFEGQLKALVAQGKRVVIVLSSPRGDAYSPRNMVQRNGFDFTVKLPDPIPRADLVAEMAYIDGPIRRIAERVGADIIDPMDQLCTAEVCPTLDASGNPLFIDETHLRSTVARTHFTAFDRYVYLGLLSGAKPR